MVAYETVLNAEIDRYDDEYYSLRAAARILGMEKPTLAQWRRKGKVKALRIGWQWWIHKDELERLILERQVA